MKTETYELTVLNRADNTEAAVYVVEVLDTEGRNIANKRAREHFATDFSDFVTSGVRKISAAKAAKMVNNGARDLRVPAVATTENRKRLGSLVGF
jgi:hypothetical protein